MGQKIFKISMMIFKLFLLFVFLFVVIVGYIQIIMEMVDFKVSIIDDCFENVVCKIVDNYLYCDFGVYEVVDIDIIYY